MSLWLFSYDGITRIRFYGYNLSLCPVDISTPSIVCCCKGRYFHNAAMHLPCIIYHLRTKKDGKMMM